MEGGRFLFAEGAEFACAAFDDGWGYVARESGGAGAGAHGVGKNVEVGERADIDEFYGG